MKQILFVLVALAIFSCKQHTEAEIKTAPSQTKEIAPVMGDLNETEETVAVTFKTEEASQIHQAYLELKGALVNTDADDASEVAQEFEQMLNDLTQTSITTKLAADLKIISAADTAADQRVVFEDVSKRVELYLSGQIASGSLIKQYCPMAFDGKGAYWLSDSKEVRNPYYGDKMLKCGVVDKEIE